MKFNFDFYSKKHIFMALSCALLLVGLVGGIVNGGMNLDIQFEGGTLLEIPMNEDNFDTADVQGVVSRLTGKVITAQKQTLFVQDGTAEGNMTLHLVIKASKSETLSNDEISQVQAELDSSYGIKEGQSVNVRTVEPYIGETMLFRGMLAIGIASLLILLYVWIRFSVMSGLSAALCATLGLVHDALIMVAFYAVFRLPINDSFIAAILTVIGYSINDTIIVYDRIRENNKTQKKLAYSELVNNSLNQTLTRSMNTIITTLISVVTVLVFASVFKISSLVDFCVPLVVGLIAGKYSTLYIATQTWAMWQTRKQKRLVAQP